VPFRLGGVLVLCVWAAACNWDVLIVSPGAVVVGGEPTLALHPVSPFPQTVPFPSCPSVQPATARFEIVLSNGRVDHDLDRIDVSFADRNGSAGSSLSFTSSEIVRDFGSTTVASGRSRTIVIVLGVGCGTMTTGTIVVHVRLHDVTGKSVMLSDRIAVS
jgi:hypothetical protein